METRHVLVEMKPAVKEDFANADGSKKINVLYFQQSITGMIEKQACYFTLETDLTKFRELYACGQIWVPISCYSPQPKN